MKTLLPLTSTLKVDQGSHILYFYETNDGYIENAASFILSGISLGQHIIFIDSVERFQLIIGRLGFSGHPLLHYVNNFEFYELYQDFHFERVLNNLKTIVDPYVESDLMIRIWGHVDWVPQENMLSKLHTYECKCDITVSELGFTTVCAYEGGLVPSNILIEMMKSHEYMMTDRELFRSNLYKSFNDHNPTLFPSLSAQRNLDTEMDLYKQKLDFVHVVSHEVRNPLTVINAYAKILKETEEDAERQERLQAIQNYVAVIDNEISHIIYTEQLLSTDALWQKKLIVALKPLREVVDFMTIKAQTQNIHLQTELHLTGKEMLLSNLMGIKMILSNLLSNAIKYSAEGGTVYLRMEAKDSLLIIEVVDEGIGMTENQVRMLYTKYEKMNQEQSGQGIGLFMVKKLVDYFDGAIKVESEQDKGTLFRVELPIYT
jgi:two-component sensor histidine kinase